MDLNPEYLIFYGYRVTCTRVFLSLVKVNVASTEKRGLLKTKYTNILFYPVKEMHNC